MNKSSRFVKIVTTLLVAISISNAPAWAQQPEVSSGYTEKTAVYGKRFMIAAANPHAVKAGYKILKQGGSAIDAAIATQMVLGLVEGQSSGIGGDASLLYWNANKKQLSGIDGRVVAPATADEELFYDRYGERMGRKEAGFGGLAVGTPTLLRVLEGAHKRFGKLPWARLFQPAIALAEAGFPVSHRLHVQISKNERILEDPTAKAYFFDSDGNPRPIGYRLMNKPYAALLRRIAEQGAAAFYDSDIPEKIAHAVKHAAHNPGRLTAEDIRNYKPEDVTPACVSYRGYKVCGMPPPNTGGLAIAMTLRMLERFDLKSLGFDSVKAHHLYVEAYRLAHADRTRYIGDPRFYKTPGLLDGTYLRERSARIDPSEKSRVRSGSPPDRPSRSLHGEDSPEPPSTTHMSIVDSYGNAISLTTSLGLGFGTGLMVEGFLLNSQLRGFGFKPTSYGRPNINRPESGKRPPTSKSPTIVFNHDGSLRLVIGSPGGGRIINYVARALIAVLDWGMDVQKAISLPHILPRRRRVELERDTSAENFEDALESLGHDTKIRRLTSGLHGIEITPNGLVGGADPRREGVALGE
ncbi:MAG TPA: gamma-glutamyltransferase [Rhodospirillaceae bacterium]|nr:gamma-glutamyltransferase [Rhodospirillaceae bacterium]